MLPPCTSLINLSPLHFTLPPRPRRPPVANICLPPPAGLPLLSGTAASLHQDDKQGREQTPRHTGTNISLWFEQIDELHVCGPPSAGVDRP